MKDIQFNERKQHGLPDFPFQYYFIDSSHPQYIMPLHWHSEFEIIRVLEGCFELFIDNRSIMLKKGEIALIDCTAMHRGTPENAVYECIVFSLSMLYKKSNDIIRKYLRPIAHHSVTVTDKPAGKATDIINKLFDTAKTQEEYYELTLHSLLFEFFCSLYQEDLVKEQNSKQKNEKQLSIITELMDWIDKNLTENITLSDLSLITGMNEKYLCRFFKEYTGRTPIDYINNLRVEAACHELIHSGLSVTEAALECGFNSISYFTKTFKKYKNMSPNEYRKSITVS